MEEEDSIYDIEGITFNEIQCTFTKDISQGLSNKLVDKLSKNKKQVIVIHGQQQQKLHL